MVAFEAAYRAGDAWLEALMAYLQRNCQQVADFFQHHLPCIRVALPEATFLLWLDCRAMGMTDAQLRQFFVDDCKLGLNPGLVFGEGGSGFMRMNIGTTSARIGVALNAVKAAWDRRGG